MLFAALKLPQVDVVNDQFDFYLHAGSDGFFLTSPLPDLEGKFTIDFIGGAVGFRWRSNEGKRQPLARACGLHKLKDVYVLDLTAGMGRDAFLMARLGARVEMVERAPVLALLLQDAMERARRLPELSEVINRMVLYAGDGAERLDQLAETGLPDVIYLDPMYPHRTKSALVKKEMRFIRALVGDDEDAECLLQAALQKARNRVVVKRPKGAPVLGGRDPSYSVTSPNTRYDIYLCA